MSIEDLKRALVEVKKICTDSNCCDCPFARQYDSPACCVVCRLSDDEYEMFTPLCWDVDDWKEDVKDEIP